MLFIILQYIVDTFRDLGWSIEEDAFMANTPHGAKPFRNLMVTPNAKSCKRLVLACHYDSKYFKKGEFVAATDSAVPCAMMISLAKTLDAALKDKAIKNPSSTSLQLIFFDGEEAFENWSQTDSLYGSRHLAEKLNKTPIVDTECKSNDLISELDRIELMVLLDLLGAQSPKFYSYFPESDESYARLLNIEQSLSSSQVLTGQSNSYSKGYFQNRRSFSYIEDDHIPFFQRGVKIIHVIPSPFPSVWHKLSDNGSALHHPTINDLLKIFKVFVSEYLNLNVQLI